MVERYVSRIAPIHRAMAGALVALGLMVAACAPAAPSPTAAPAKPAVQPTSAPAKPAATTAPAKPAASPAAKVETKPAASPVAKTEAKPAGSPVAKIDTKAVEAFYTGKTIRIFVGSAPGGGYDTYARAIARHLGNHIPGNPNVIVENMPGAGSLKAANHVYKAADKDGTAIGHIQGGLFLQQLLGLPGVEFDALAWRLLGLPTSDNNTCVATAKSGMKTIADAQKPNGKQFIVGGNAPGSATWDVANRLRVALDLNMKVVEGYDGTAKVRLAMDQGEVDGMCGWGWESLKATGLDRVEAGDWVVITQVLDTPIDHPVMKNVPLASQFAKTEEDKQLIRLGIMVPSKILRPFVMAPDVPADRVLALRQAFDATMKDKDFMADAAKSKLELDPITGEEGEKLVRDLFQMPAVVKDKLKLINDKKI